MWRWFVTLALACAFAVVAGAPWSPSGAAPASAQGASHRKILY